MATATILPPARTVFIDSNGTPLIGGKLYTFVPPATSTPKTTWQDAGESTPNSNPIILDSNGSALMYGSGQYYVVLNDSLGNLIWNGLTQDTYGLLITGNNTFSGANNFVTQAPDDNTTLAATTAFVQSNSKIVVKTFTRDISLASGSQSVTGVGFKPKTVLFTAGINGTPFISWGSDDGTTSLSLANSAASFAINTNGAASIFVNAGGSLYEGRISSLDTDGFTIAWTKTGGPSGTLTINYTAIR